MFQTTNKKRKKKLHADSAETWTPATAPAAGTRRFWKTKATAYIAPEKADKTLKIGRSCVLETAKYREILLNIDSTYDDIS